MIVTVQPTSNCWNEKEADLLDVEPWACGVDEQVVHCRNNVQSEVGFA